MIFKALIYVSFRVFQLWSLATVLIVLNIYLLNLNPAAPFLLLGYLGLFALWGIVFRHGMQMMLSWRLMWRLKNDKTKFPMVVEYLGLCYHGFTEKKITRVFEDYKRKGLIKTINTQGNLDCRYTLTSQGGRFLLQIGRCQSAILSIACVMSIINFDKTFLMSYGVSAILPISMLMTIGLFMSFLFFDELEDRLTPRFFNKDSINNKPILRIVN